MGKPLGSPKTGGRQKGTLNKRTLNFADDLEHHGLDLLEEITKLLPELSPDKRAGILLGLMCYQYPKRKQIDKPDEVPARDPMLEKYEKMTPEDHTAYLWDVLLEREMPEHIRKNFHLFWPDIKREV